MSKGLVLIDIQNDYFSGGSMTLENMDNAAKNASHLLTYFREHQLPIFHIQHISTREGSTFFIPNTRGSEIHDSVKPLANEPVVIKHFPSSFRDTELHDLLRSKNINELIICGAMSHMCIDTTTRAAFDLGYKCTVISDACATKSLEFNNQVVSASDVHAAFMAALSAPFATVIPTERFINLV